MSALKRRQDSTKQKWQKADARILGQILAAQNVVFALPDTSRIAEFYAGILSSIPGIAASRVCLEGKSASAGEMASACCTGCIALHDSDKEDGKPTPFSLPTECGLAEQPGLRILAVESNQHRFGYFVLKIEQDAASDLYQPFVSNLASYVALILENRWQKEMLQKGHDELERKVEERTLALTAANKALADSRLEALDTMKKAVAAQRRAEIAGAGLERAIDEHKQVEREYRTLIESVPDFIVRYDLELRRIYVNPAWERASGLSASEVVGVAYADNPRVPSPVNAEYLKKLRLALDTGTPQVAEFTWVNAHGKELFLEYLIVPEYDHHGRVAGVLAVGRDISKRRQAEDALQRMNRQLRAISTCNQVLMQASDEQSLLDHICRIICEEAGYRMAWVGYPRNDDARTIPPVAWAGVEKGYLAEAAISWADAERGRGPTGQALREGISACIQDFATDPHAAPWRQSAAKRGYRSSIALPLKEESGPPFGVLCIYSDVPNAFIPDEMRLLEELAGNLAFGITNLRLRAEHKKAEKQILASEQLFRALVENAPDFIARYDCEYRRIYVNPAIQKLFGEQEKNVLHKTPADQSPLYAPQVYIDHLRQVIETATESTAEIPFRTTRGEMHYGHIRFVPEFDTDGHVISVLTIGRDIHEIKENELRFRRLAENFPDFVARFDHDGQYTYVNPAFRKTFGLPAEAAIGKSLRELPRGRKPEQNDALLELIHRAFDEGVANESEVCWDTKAGKRFYDIRHAPERDAAGNVVSVLSIARDITERKQADEELARYKEHLEEMVQARTLELEQARNKAQQYLDIAGAILVAVDAQRRVTLINQKGCEILESTSDEIIGQDWFATFIPEKVRPGVIRAFRQLMAGELDPAEYLENPVLTRSGRQRLVAWHNVLLRDDEGHVIGTLSSGEDITRRRHAERQIINLNQDLQKRASELEAANKELDAFAYSVSHDLRAPLRHIDGFIELLQKKVGKAQDEQSRHYMDTISESAKRMGVLIDDLLSFSRMGRRAMSTQQVVLGDLVHDVIQELSPDAVGRAIDWRVGDLPMVCGDATMLRRVLANLIGNALKFTRPRQKARIEIGSLPDQDSETVIFVGDNGVGFDMTYVDKLYGVFQRLHRADEFEGTGIGLANVRRIIARHGGRTWAASVPGQGATFYFSLPCKLKGDGDERP
ncbi:MAG: PAS domain S-box protein [Desulfobacteraceae bacterium]